MKAVTLVMGLFASIVSAQTIGNCTLTSTLPGIQTITDLVISTYCPVCDEAKATGGVYTTVYETELLAVCPTGLTSSVYTVTNVCTGTTPIDTSTLAPGFTTTTVGCNCAASSVVTITTPIAPAANTAVNTAAASVYTTAGEPTTYVSAGVTITSTPAVTVTSSPTAGTAAAYTGAASSLSNNLAALALGFGSVFFGVAAL